MSLQTDRIFIEALCADEAIHSVTEGRIYSTAIPMPELDADNVPAPYIIVTFDGFQNNTETKDMNYEGEEDIVNIGVEIVGRTRQELATIAEQARVAVRTWFEEYTAPEEGEDMTLLIPIDYTLTGSEVFYDEFKPAYIQRLQYNCTTNLT